MTEGEAIVLFALGFIAVYLTSAMFHTKQMMLGFPCVIFWAILGGYCYLDSTATWDWQYFVFFGSMGMVIFSLLAMYALRTRKEEKKEGDELIDEGKEKEKFVDEDDDVSPRRKAVRKRADARRGKY